MTFKSIAIFATLEMFDLYFSNKKQSDNNLGDISEGKTSSFPMSIFSNYLNHFHLRYVIFFEYMLMGYSED